MSISEKALGLFVRVHDALYQRTNGWIGHRIQMVEDAVRSAQEAA